MKRMTIALCAGLLLAAGAATRGVGADFTRYQVILERMPFGSVAREVVPVTVVGLPPVAPQDSFVRDLRLVGLTETEAGLRVGFVDIKQQPAKPYFLYIGESEDGIEVVDAEYERDRALLRKGDEEQWIVMGGGVATGGVSPSPGGGGAVPLPIMAGVSRPGGLVGVPPAAEGTRSVRSSEAAARYSAMRRTSYDERLRRRREAQEAERKRLQEEAKMTGEDLEKHLMNLQMDLIRKGDPPLPIPLTPEMDDQLVAEGVLPPAE